MSNASRSFGASDKQEKVGPDYFGYYTSEVVNLLSQDEDVVPVATNASEMPQNKCGEGTKKNSINHGDDGSGPLYSNGVGAGFSDLKKDRLRLLLRQSVTTLSSEVDEAVAPVFALYQLQSNLQSKTHSLDQTAIASDDAVQIPCKKSRVSSPSSSSSLHEQTSDVNPTCNKKGSKDKSINSKPFGMPLSKKEISKKQKCSTYDGGDESSSQKLASAPLQGEDFHLDSNMGVKMEDGEVKDDLQFLLENNGVEVQEMVKKYSTVASGTLEYMEQQLEVLLDAVMSKCRPMNLREKQQLQRLIQKLPAKNLDRVAEIVCRSKPTEKSSSDELIVDLEKEDNATLWRLYYYVEAVEKAKNLSCRE